MNQHFNQLSLESQQVIKQLIALADEFKDQSLVKGNNQKRYYPLEQRGVNLSKNPYLPLGYLAENAKLNCFIVDNDYNGYSGYRYGYTLSGECNDMKVRIYIKTSLRFASILGVSVRLYHKNVDVFTRDNVIYAMVAFARHNEDSCLYNSLCDYMGLSYCPSSYKPSDEQCQLLMENVFRKMLPYSGFETDPEINIANFSLSNNQTKCLK